MWEGGEGGGVGGEGGEVGEGGEWQGEGGGEGEEVVVEDVIDFASFASNIAYFCHNSFLDCRIQ